MACQPCGQFCAECKGPSTTSCTKCDKGMNRALRGGQCHSCVDGYVETKDSNRHCVKAKELKSEECDDNQFLKEGECYQCDESCASCKGPAETDCETCDSSRNLEFYQG